MISWAGILFLIFLKKLFFLSQGAQLNHNIPAFLFGSAAISVAISVLFGPETFRKKLPETLVDAIKL